MLLGRLHWQVHYCTHKRESPRRLFSFPGNFHDPEKFSPETPTEQRPTITHFSNLMLQVGFLDSSWCTHVVDLFEKDPLCILKPSKRSRGHQNHAKFDAVTRLSSANECWESVFGTLSGKAPFSSLILILGPSCICRVLSQKFGFSPQNGPLFYPDRERLLHYEQKEHTSAAKGMQDPQNMPLQPD